MFALYKYDPRFQDICWVELPTYFGELVVAVKGDGAFLVADDKHLRHKPQH